MKTETRELLGFNVPVVGIVETLQEAITAAGSEEAVLKDFVSNVLAHSHYTILRRLIVKKLVELSGIKQKGHTEGEGEKTKFVIDEKDAEYVARLESEAGEDVVKSFESQIASACAAMAVDYTPGVRGSGDRTPAKKWLAYYDQLVTENKLEAFCEKHSIDQTVDPEELKITVANKVKDIVSAKLAQAAKEATEV